VKPQAVILSGVKSDVKYRSPRVRAIASDRMARVIVKPGKKGRSS
jgi:hypothetical protein